MATNTTSGSTASPKRTPRKRAAGARTRNTGTRASVSERAASLGTDAKSAVRSVKTRARRVARKVPTDRTSLSIGAGLIAGLVAAGVAIFMNRDRLRTAAASGGERIRKAADDLSSMAHERIDQARDNITRLRTQGHSVDQSSSATGTNGAMSATH